MPEPSVIETAGLVQPCAICGQYEATLRAPDELSSLLGGETLACEVCADPGRLWDHCEPLGLRPGRQGFVAVELEFLERVRPGLTATEFCTYLAAVQLCDGLRALCSLSKLATAAALSRRNVVDAVRLLERIGVLVKAGTYGAKGSRYLVVRAQLIGSDPVRPCLVRPSIYREAQAALSVIRGSPVGARSVQPDHQTGDPGITGTGDLGITDRLSYDPKGIQLTNKLHQSPAHPPPNGRNGAAAPCSLFEQAAEAAATDWPDYSLSCLTERATTLAGWADEAGEPVSAEQIARFFRDGAGQAWIRRGVERGRISSGLHVWCDRDRWIHRLKESNRAAARRAEREQAARVRELPPAERARLARAALAELERPPASDEGN